MYLVDKIFGKLPTDQAKTESEGKTQDDVHGKDRQITCNTTVIL